MKRWYWRLRLWIYDMRHPQPERSLGETIEDANTFQLWQFRDESETDRPQTAHGHPANPPVEPK